LMMRGLRHEFWLTTQEETLLFGRIREKNERLCAVNDDKCCHCWHGHACNL
jgi:hypothetical protein